MVNFLKSFLNFLSFLKDKINKEKKLIRLLFARLSFERDNTNDGDKLKKKRRMRMMIKDRKKESKKETIKGGM